jgi:4-amino-4-deoxy-L-arabinose transferase-like glycosyltransferase
MSRTFLKRLPAWFWIWAVLTGTMLAVRPALPVDETRYLAVAWEMWWRGSIAVPYLNGVFYDGKPPLFFWLMQLGWGLFGVNEWWPRALAPLFGLADLVLVGAIARRLWGAAHPAVTLAPLILLGSIYWALFCASTMFDVLLGFFALLTVYAFVRAWQEGGARYFILAGAALGGGILCKGPVVFLPALFIVLTAPWWMGPQRAARIGWRGWYGGALGAAAIAGLIAAAWLIPMALASDSDYLKNMLFKQNAGYVSDSFSHARPIWWYLPLLPALLFPWTCWPRAWRAIAAPGAALRDPGVRLCLAWAVPVLITFSLISGKQAHYLLLMFPAVALLLGRLLPEADRGRDRSILVVAAVPVAVGAALIIAAAAGLFPAQRAAWIAQIPAPVPYAVGAGLIGVGLAVAAARGASLESRVVALAAAGCAVLLVVITGFMRASGPAYDMRPTSAFLSTLEREGAPLALAAHYSGEFNFYGRLKTRIEPTPPSLVPSWGLEHPDGYVIAFYPVAQWPLAAKTVPVHQSLHRGGGIAVWRARDLARQPALLPSFK